MPSHAATLELGRRWGIDDRARFDQGRGGLPKLAIRTPLAEADIYLHGAHVTHFKPAGTDPLLYLSPESAFAPRQPIRGGIPICFPWFAQHKTNPDLPLHGFVRLLPWQIDELTESADGRVRVGFTFEHHQSDEMYSAFPHPFRLRLSITVGNALDLHLHIENTGDQPLSCEAMMHTYLAVRDVRQVQLLGLENINYLDKTDDYAQKTQPTKALSFAGETDRIYLDTPAHCRLLDVPSDREIIIEKSGSQTTVVWTPWVAKTQTLRDIPDEDWPHLLCVETGHASDNALEIAPRTSHTMTTTLSTAPTR
ncbi:MAG: D-hexose-6-phosphate mutarotase [Phycisphaeraceae bacterium]